MYYLDAKDRLKLVQELVVLFSGDALLALEGELGVHERELSTVPGSSTDETRAPAHYDFFVLPLTEETAGTIRTRILPRIGVATSVYHLQIENGGELVFGAYDNFGRDQVWITSGVAERWLVRLRERGILRNYRKGEVG